MKLAVIATLVVGYLVLAPSRADAKVPIIYQTGEEAFRCGPIPEPFDKEPELAGFYAGYICNIKGVFWSYFSVSNCRPAAIKGDSFFDAPELVAAIKAKYPQSSMQRGIWNKYGWMLLAAVVVIGLIMIVKDKITGKGDDD